MCPQLNKNVNHNNPVCLPTLTNSRTTPHPLLSFSIDWKMAIKGLLRVRLRLCMTPIWDIAAPGPGCDWWYLAWHRGWYRESRWDEEWWRALSAPTSDRWPRTLFPSRHRIGNKSRKMRHGWKIIEKYFRSFRKIATTQKLRTLFSKLFLASLIKKFSPI